MKDEDSKKIDFIFSYATYVLRKYLLQKYDIDLSSVCKVVEKNPEIELKIKDKSYFMYLDIVQPDYCLNYNIILDNIVCEDDKIKMKEELVKHCTFLVNAVNNTYEYLKRTIKRSKDDDNYFLIMTNMMLDDNTNLYLDEKDNYKIGIKIRNNNN